jgi:hypothetical protein
MSHVILHIVRGSVLSWLLLLTIGCSDSGLPTAPTPRPELGPAGSPPTGIPPLSKPGRVYQSAAPLNYPLQPYTLGSRFVLYDDGTFALDYDATLQYRGTYTEQDRVITFEFEGWSTATGWLGDRTLTVRYNVEMMLSDFENAVYTLVE